MASGTEPLPATTHDVISPLKPPPGLGASVSSILWLWTGGPERLHSLSTDTELVGGTLFVLPIQGCSNPLVHFQEVANAQSYQDTPVAGGS